MSSVLVKIVVRSEPSSDECYSNEGIGLLRSISPLPYQLRVRALAVCDSKMPYVTRNSIRASIVQGVFSLEFLSKDRLLVSK